MLSRVFLLFIFFLTASCVLENNPIDSGEEGIELSWESTAFPRINGEYPAVSGLAVNSINDVFACTNTGLIYRKFDQDTAWQRIASIGLPCTFLEIDTNDVLYAGYRSYGLLLGGGIIYSTDNGEKWDFFFNELKSANCLAVKDHETYFCGTFFGVFRSQNSGQTWTQANEGLVDTIISTITYNADNDLLFAGSGSQGIFRSSDNGDNWQGAGLDGRSIIDLTASPAGVIFAGTAAGVFRSKDEGNSWKLLDSGIPNAGIYSLKSIKKTGVLAGTGDGIYYSPGGGPEWHFLGLSNKRVTNVDVNSDGRIYAAADSFGVMRSVEAVFQ